MSDNSQDSSLSTAANIIGLITFALSAINLLIVRILQRERLMFEERRITKWMESARLLHLKSAYFNLFDARGILRGKRVVAETLPSSHEDSVDRILEDVDQCYGRPKQIVQKMPDYDFPPSLGLHIQTMIVILLSGEFKGFCDMLVTDWRRFFQAKIWREKKKTFEENYKEFSAIVAQLDSYVLLIQGLNIVHLQE